MMRVKVLRRINGLRDRDVYGNKVEKRSESLGTLVVTSRNSSKRFDSVNEFLPPISLFIGCFVIIENIDTIFLWQNDNLHRVALRFFPEFIAIVPLMITTF